MKNSRAKPDHCFDILPIRVPFIAIIYAIKKNEANDNSKFAMATIGSDIREFWRSPPPRSKFKGGPSKKIYIRPSISNLMTKKGPQNLGSLESHIVSEKSEGGRPGRPVSEPMMATIYTYIKINITTK